MAQEGTSVKKQFYSWQEFDADVAKIAEWARDKGFKSIYGIPRGGLVPAVVLSHRLEIPILVSFTDVTKVTLVIDDISDTGKTLMALESRLGFTPSVATLFWQKNTIRKPAFSVREKTDWVVFPWETEKSSEG